jgi:methylphosphotriester-DNA--protein-cysteine methyltransferase
MGSVYREHPPRRAIAAFVRCVWTFVPEPDEAPQRIAPDGYPELIVHVGVPYMEQRDAGYIEQPAVLFAGQLTRPLTLLARGGAAVIGMRFQPHAARAFLGVAAEIAVDRRLDLASVHGPFAAALAACVREQPDAQAQIELVEDYVEGRLAGAAVDAEVRACVEAMIAGCESRRPAAAAERQWQRRFKAEVGVSQRMLQAVLRFRRVFDAIDDPRTSGWVEAAIAAGYFDQPQMARDFRRFLGCTARDWAAQRAGLAKSLTTVGYKTEAAGYASG